MKFSVQPSCFFPGLSLSEALRAMTAEGFTFFELWQVAETEVEGIRRAMDETGASLHGICVDCFELTDSARYPDFERGLASALQKLKSLGGRALITQVGQDTGEERARQHDAIVEGLNRVKHLLEDEGVTLLVEPLNDVKDHIGYYLTDSKQGAQIIRQVDSPRVRLLYDIYHQLHMGEDVLSRIEASRDVIGELHAAGFPNRDQCLRENFDYWPVFQYLQESALDAPVGLELFSRSVEDAYLLLKALTPFEDK